MKIKRKNTAIFGRSMAPTQRWVRIALICFIGILMILFGYVPAAFSDSLSAILQSEAGIAIDSKHLQNHYPQRLLDFIRRLPKALKEHDQSTIITFTFIENSSAKRCSASDYSNIVQFGSQSDLESVVLHHLIHRYDTKHQISASRAWREISGWQAFKIYRPTTWDEEADNQNHGAYANKEAMKNPTHDFVNFAENYLTAREVEQRRHLKCNIPRKYHFVSNLFKNSAFSLLHNDESIVCPSLAAKFMADAKFTDPMTGASMDLGPVDESHIKGFEVLYATPGTDDIAELAGHLLLRIKLDNNPDADRLGIENPKDLVISFLADTEAKKLDEQQTTQCSDRRAQSLPQIQFDPLGETIQALKGLTGGLSTVFHRATLINTIYNYTIFQDRNLLRYELILSKTQKKQLIEHLYHAKLNYSTRYFFFDANCASILIQKIAEGIGNQKIKELNTPVMPPNSLVAMLVRQGLAKPVIPAFYSYRREGLAASKVLSRKIFLYKHSDLSGLLATSANERAKTYHQILSHIPKDLEQQKQLYSIAQVGQYVEMQEYENDSECAQITNDAITGARRVQRKILLALDTESVKKSSHSALIHQELRQSEEGNARGISHTKLMPLSLGLQKDDRGSNHASLGFSIFKQELGSSSRYAMQRTAELKLSSLDVLYNGTSGLQYIRYRGLALSKLRENLEEVPTVWTEPSRIGISLKVLDGVDDKRLGYTKLIYAGAGIVVNLFSSDYYDDFLQMGIGLELYKDWIKNGDPSKDRDGFLIESPIYLQGGLTLGSSRRSHLRFRAEWLANDTEIKLNPYNSYIKASREFEFQRSAIEVFGGVQQNPYNNKSLQFNSFNIGLEYQAY